MDHGLCGSGKCHCCGTIPMMHQVAGHHTANINIKKVNVENTNRKLAKGSLAACRCFYQYCDCWIYFQVTGCSLLQNRLPVSQSFSDGEAGDHAVDLGPPFAHVVLNVKHKRLLAKISIYYLPWSLQPYCGVQVRLKWETEKERAERLLRRAPPFSISNSQQESFGHTLTGRSINPHLSSWLAYATLSIYCYRYSFSRCGGTYKWGKLQYKWFILRGE